MLQRIAIFTMLLATLPGCLCCKDPLPNPCIVCTDPACDPCADLVAQIEYPDVHRCEEQRTIAAGPPRRLEDGLNYDFWELSLEEAIQIALQNSTVLKDLGGRVLASPQAVGSVFDPSIAMSHPRLGEEAALSAFDAQYQDLFLYNRGEQAFNNATLAGGATVINSDGWVWNSQLSKTAATGTQFGLSRRVEYQNSDAPFNLFPSVYTGSIQATVRQPLLQGAGVCFNRIVGPTNNPDLSQSRGVILARINGDISVANFELGVRNFVRDVESAYWQLYLAYRVLDGVRAGRDASRETWQTVKARYDAELRGGEADAEAQAREQMFLFEQRVVEALNGTNGVYGAERQLRRMMGLPVSDERLIRPAEEPSQVPVKFDWYDCLTDALVRRVELRQQMWRVKQRELELIAAKNFLLPRLDAVASFSVDGFGDDLFGGGDDFNSLATELRSFDFNRSQVGVQLAVPLGYRRELAGVRHAKLNLCRERAVLQDQEHLISHQLGDAFAALETSLESIALNESRLEAAGAVVASRLAVFEAGKLQIDVLLEAQRRLVDAQQNYFQTRVRYALAMRDLHFEKGTLLPFSGVHLQEGPWSREACEQAWQERRRWVASHDEKQTVPCPVSLGEYDETIDETGIAQDAHAEYEYDMMGEDFPVEVSTDDHPEEYLIDEFVPEVGGEPATQPLDDESAPELITPEVAPETLTPDDNSSGSREVGPSPTEQPAGDHRLREEGMVEAVTFLREVLAEAEQK